MTPIPSLGLVGVEPMVPIVTARVVHYTMARILAPWSAGPPVVCRPAARPHNRYDPDNPIDPARFFDPARDFPNCNLTSAVSVVCLQ